MKSMFITVLTILCVSVFSQAAGEPDSAASGKMVVTATRVPTPLKATPGVVYLVDRRELDAVQADRPADVLDYVPGIDVEGGTGVGTANKRTVSINGTPSFHTLVLVDGRRLLSSHFHTGTDINLVPADNIDRIEVVKDASSALYGSDALGGVVNLITRRGAEIPSLSLNLKGGTQNTFGGSLGLLGPVSHRVRHSTFISWDRTDGVPILATSFRSEDMDFRQFTLMERVDADLPRGAKAGASLHYAALDDLPWRGAMYDSWLVTPGVDLSVPLSGNLKLSALGYYTQWHADLSNEKHELASPQAWLTYTGVKNHAMTAGGEYDWRNFRRDGVPESDQGLAAFFAQDETTLFAKLTLLAALRVDEVLNTGKGAGNIGPVVSPKLSLIYVPLDWLTVRAAGGRGFRAPNVQDLYESRYHPSGGGIWRYGNPDLEPEYSTSASGGVEVMPLGCLTLFGNGFYSRLTDMIAVVDGGRDTVYAGGPVPVLERKNIHKYQMQSMEFGARFQKSVWTAEVSGSATFQQSDDPEGDDALSFPGQNARLKLGANVPVKRAGTLNGFLGVKAAFNRTSPGGDTLRDYINLEAGLGWTFLDRVEIYAKGMNLLGEEMDIYEDALFTIEGTPRFEGGVRVKVF